MRTSVCPTPPRQLAPSGSHVAQSPLRSKSEPALHMQASDDVLRGRTVVLPRGHAEQAVAPGSPEYEPMLHTWHSLCPWVAANRPGGHSAQLSLPNDAALRPAGHKEHDEAPGPAKLPAPHERQPSTDDRPTAVELLPEEQGTHPLELSEPAEGLKLPGQQEVHVDGSGEALPQSSGQGL